MLLPDALDVPGVPGARLRAIEATDWPLEHALGAVPDVARWSYIPGDASPAEARARVARSVQLRADGRGGRFVVEHLGASVGTIGVVLRVDRPFLSYALLPVGRGFGLATCGVVALSDWVLTHGATWVHAATMVGNGASERVLDRASFERCGLEVRHDGITVNRWRLSQVTGP